MNESERRQENIQQQKDRIRRRYQGTVSEKVRIIPVTVAQPDVDDDSTTKRVAVMIFLECIRCGQCVDACPRKCLHFSGKDRSGYKPEESQPS